MQISQHNYEEFFLMYVDNELSVQEKEMVEAFVRQHPELAGELELLKQTVFGADETIEFARRDQLARRPEITEEDLLTYLDGEAEAELAGKIEQGILNNDALKHELEDFGKLYLRADPSIQYPSKGKLYKGAVIRRLDWRKLAVAASLLLCVSTWMVLNQSDDEIQSGDAHVVAINTPPDTQPAVNAPPVIDTNTNADTPVLTGASSSEANSENAERQSKVSAKNYNQVAVQSSLSEPATGKQEMVSAPTVIEENGNKINQLLPQRDPGKVSLDPITKPSSVERAPEIAAVQEPTKEKKSLFKKLGKQISERALDILSDDGDNINVAGFAIRVEK